MKTATEVMELQKQCDIWNHDQPIGTRVLLTKDDGRRYLTKTRSAAEVLSGHSAVIWLEGVRGCYLLSRCEPFAKCAEWELRELLIEARSLIREARTWPDDLGGIVDTNIENLDAR